jgi:hypothetical protein
MSFQLEPGADVRPRYRMGGLGFGLSAVALSLLCIALAVILVFDFTRDQPHREFTHHPLWIWLVSAPIAWLSLVGCYLIWTPWDSPGWRRRAGFLLLLNGVDLFFWFLDHAADLGLAQGPQNIGWTRMLLGRGLGWIQYGLYASLAGDLLEHLGDRSAQAASRATQGMAWTGFALLFLLAVTCTDFNRWPLMQRRLHPEEYELAIMNLRISSILLLIVVFRITFACAAAARHCNRLVAEWNQAIDSPSVLRPQADDPYAVTARR